MSGAVDKPGDAGKGFLGYFVTHKTAANLLLVLMMMAGIYSATQLRAQFFPDIVRETITVGVQWEGSGAQDVDEAVITVLEPSLLAVSGVEEVISTSREGRASIVMTFEDGWDMGQASDDVQSAVDTATTLPEEIEDPTVTRGAFRDRVVDIAISGNVGIDRLASYSDELLARLFQAGVSRTSVSGIPDTVVTVQPSAEALLRYNLTLTEVANSVTRQVTGVPTGDVDARAQRVRAGEDRRTIPEIGATPIRTLPDGTELTLRDIADIRDAGFRDAVQSFRNGQPAIIVSVQRASTGDALKVQAAVDKVVAAMRSSLPEGVEIVTGRSRAEPISDRLNMLIKNGLSGLVLVLILLFLFLSARTAFWVSAGIPISIAATLGIMYFSGQTLNMISMFALIISLGIIVDDAIVVGEHADDLRRKGHSPSGAAGTAARRMAAPVVSASITTVIAFAGLVAVGGRFGALISAIPFVVSAVIVASLIESFLILPSHMRHALSAKNENPWYDWPSRQFNRGFGWFRDTLFRPFITWVVRLRYVTIAAAISALLFSVSMLVDGTVRWEFFSRPEQGTISANVIMQTGATREDTRKMIDEMNRALLVVNDRYGEEYGTAPVDFASATLGENVGRRFTAGDNKPADLLGGMQAALIDADLRPYSSYKFQEDWSNEVKVSPEVELFAFRSARAGPGGDAIDVKFTGADAQTLKAASEALKAGLSNLDGVSGLDDSLVYDKVELVLTLTPLGKALGFTTQGLGSELRARLTGIDAAEFARDARQVTIRVEPPKGEIGADYLETARVRAPDGNIVTLGEIVNIRSRQGFASIIRQDGLRVASVTGEIDDAPGVQAAVYEVLEGALLPAIAAEYGVQYQTAGAAEDERAFLSDAGYGFLMCLAGIYLTLAWVFASWVRPFVVMAVIPFGLIGAMWGHYWMGLSLSMFSVVGLIGMSGIIINDSIVLVTTIDEYAEKRGRIPSIIAGSTDRLRAVLLTTMTTVGGLTPLLFETSRQALFLKPTVVTLAFGLGFGVVLVLLLTPSVMAVEHDVRMALNSLRHLLRLRGKQLTRRRRRSTAGRRRLTRTQQLGRRYGQRAEPFPKAAE